MTTTPARPDLAYINATRAGPGAAGHRATRPVGRQAGRLPRPGERDPRRAAMGRRHPPSGRRAGPAAAAAGLPGRDAARRTRPPRGHPGLVPGLEPLAGRQVPRPAAPRGRHRRRRTPGADRGQAVRRRPTALDDLTPATLLLCPIRLFRYRTHWKVFS